MVEDELVAMVVAGVIDVLFEVVLVEPIKVVVLEELYAPLIFEDLDVGDEDFAFEFAIEGRPHSDDNLHVVPIAAVL